MRELEECNHVDVLRIFHSMRQERGGMVQTKDQYVLLHKVGPATVTNTYSNLHIHDVYLQVMYDYGKRIGLTDIPAT